MTFNIKNIQPILALGLLSLIIPLSAQSTELEMICYEAKASIDGAQFTAETTQAETDRTCAKLEDTSRQYVDIKLYTDELVGIEQPFAQLQVEVDPLNHQVMGLQVNHNNGRGYSSMDLVRQNLAQIDMQQEPTFDVHQVWTWNADRTNTIILGKTLELRCEFRFVETCL